MQSIDLTYVTSGSKLSIILLARVEIRVTKGVVVSHFLINIFDHVMLEDALHVFVEVVVTNYMQV